MEKEIIYSASLGLGKDAELFGKWAKKNGAFIPLKKDSWHEGTQYWIPASIPDDRNLQRQLMDELSLSYTYDSFELLDLKTILIPVAEAGDLKIPLSKKCAEDKDIVKLLHSSSVKSYDIWRNFDWQSADEQKLQQYSSRIEPLDLPFIELQEEVHYLGGDSLRLVNQSVNVFYLPIKIFYFKIDNKTYNWIYIADGKTNLAINSYSDEVETYHCLHVANSTESSDQIRIVVDRIFTLKEDSVPALAGCLIPISLIAAGVGLTVFLWAKLNGFGLLISIIGVVLLLRFVNTMVIRVATRSSYSKREMKKQQILEKRNDFLAKKGLVV